MGTDAGLEILRRAAIDAANIRATDAMRAHERGPRHVAGLGDIVRLMQRQTDAAYEELVALGLSGYEAEQVLTCILCGLVPPDYPLD